MKLSHAFTLAYTGIRAKPSRTTLTLLGIAVGIMAVILIMSMGRGAERLILNEISGLGAETFVIQPGRDPTGPQDIGNILLGDSLKERDLEALKRPGNVPHLSDIMPVVLVTGSVSYQGETYRGAQMLGGDARFFGDAFNFVAEEGVLFGEAEIDRRAQIAVIGSEVKRELFGPSDALGESVMISGRKFRVTGVLPEKGRVAFLELDKLIVVPYTTALTYILGQDHFNEFVVRVDDPANVERSVRDAELTLRESHGLGPGDENDFRIETQQGLVEQIGTIITALTIFLTAVVAVALVVGGIGIMNIMLVSVTERTREIGLRKAVGARERDIMLQFLLEAILLTLAGGVVGILAGLLLNGAASLAITHFSTLAWEFAIPYDGIALSLGSATAIGLLFGLYPASQAAKKSPMEALRYE